jgi:hypothetical protein
MTNEESPAQPYINYMATSYDEGNNHYGLTKLEFASIAIAQGAVANTEGVDSAEDFARLCVRLAKAVLNEASII